MRLFRTLLPLASRADNGHVRDADPTTHAVGDSSHDVIAGVTSSLAAGQAPRVASSGYRTRASTVVTSEVDRKRSALGTKPTGEGRRKLA